MTAMNTNNESNWKRMINDKYNTFISFFSVKKTPSYSKVWISVYFGKC